MKKCNECREDKERDKFYKRARSSDGLDGKCRECRKEYDSNYYKSNPIRKEQIKAADDRRREAVRLWIIEYLQDNPCIDCGETDIVVLEFDHRWDKKFNIADMLWSHSVRAVAEEVAKCDVRCANDHRRKTARENGHWKYGLVV